MVMPSQQSGANSCGDLQIEQQLYSALKNQVIKQLDLSSKNLNRMNICFLIEGESDGKELNRQNDS